MKTQNVQIVLELKFICLQNVVHVAILRLQKEHKKNLFPNFSGTYDAKAADIWSFGCTILGLCIFEAPSRSLLNTDKLFVCLTNCSYKPPHLRNTKLNIKRRLGMFAKNKSWMVSDDLQDLLSLIFVPEAERATVDDILNNKWIQAGLEKYHSEIVEQLNFSLPIEKNPIFEEHPYHPNCIKHQTIFNQEEARVLFDNKKQEANIVTKSVESECTNQCKNNNSYVNSIVNREENINQDDTKIRTEYQPGDISILPLLMEISSSIGSLTSEEANDNEKGSEVGGGDINFEESPMLGPLTPEPNFCTNEASAFSLYDVLNIIKTHFEDDLFNSNMCTDTCSTIIDEVMTENITSE